VGNVAEPTIGASPAPAKQETNAHAKRRAALWGLGAIAALSVAVYAGSTQTGRSRLQLATTPARSMTAQAEAARPFDARDGRKLTEAVHALTDERDRLSTRLAAAEHRLVDLGSAVTNLRMGSWEALPLPEFAAAAPQARLAMAAPTKEQDAADITSSVGPSGTNAIPQPSAPGAKVQYGLDLGSGTSIEALRTTWTGLTQRHGGLLEGLHPIVNLRERSRPGGIELHLVAGPLSNAAMAARLCATMTAAGAICQPAVFDGQRLAVP